MMAAFDPSLTYAHEKFATAVDFLVTHPGKIKERIRLAALELVLIRTDTVAEHEEIEKDVKWILAQVTARDEKHEGEGRITATLRVMRISKASDVASRILSVYLKLEHLVSGRPN